MTTLLIQLVYLILSLIKKWGYREHFKIHHRHLLAQRRLDYCIVRGVQWWLRKCGMYCSPEREETADIPVHGFIFFPFPHSSSVISPARPPDRPPTGLWMFVQQGYQWAQDWDTAPIFMWPGSWDQRRFKVHLSFMGWVQNDSNSLRYKREILGRCSAQLC